MRYLFLAAVCQFIFFLSPAQNVGIGTSNPHPSAQLDISGSTRGFLMPRMTTEQRNAIPAPAKGLMIFNTDDNCTDLFDGNNWIKSCGAKTAGTGTMTDSVWRQRAGIPGTSYGRAAAFSIGTKGYVVTDGGGLLEYDPASGTWTSKAGFPPGVRYRGVAISIGTKGYFGLGTAGDPLRSDWWEYDPAANTWTQKAAFPGGGRKYAVGFSIGAKGYIGTGEDDNSSYNDFWEYDPVFNTWTQKASLTGGSRTWAMGFSVNGKGYIAGGNTGSFNYPSADLWEYTPASDSWLRRADLPFACSMGVAFSIGTKGYLGTGTDFGYLNQFYEYDPVGNQWLQKAAFPPGGRFRCIGFATGNSGFIGGGDVLTAFYNDFWEFNTSPATVNAYTTSSFPVAAIVSDGSWTRNGNTLYSSVSGNVGIGTTSPVSKLHLAGKFRLEDGSQGVNKILTSDANGLSAWQSAPWLFNGINIFSNTAGNVGIGNNSPAFPLSFATSTGDKISFSGSTGPHYGIGVQSGLLQIHGNGDFSSIAFGYGSSSAFTERARIINSGELGMQVNGRLQLRTGLQSAGMWLTNTANTSNSAFVGMASDNLVGLFGNTGAGWGLTMNTANGYVGLGLNGAQPQVPLQFSNSLGLTKISLYKGTYGDVGIGVYGGELRLQNDIPNGKVSLGVIETNGSFTELAKAERNGAYAFSIFGSLWANGITYASDQRFKKNITGISTPLQKLLQIKGVEYEMRSDEFSKHYFQSGRQIGLLAQNVESVVPEAVSAQGGYKGVDYARLVPLLIEAIKEQQQQIEVLKQENILIKSRLNIRE